MLITMSRTIVFDNGAGSLKAGMAGDKRPSHIMPNYIARVKGQVGNLAFICVCAISTTFPQMGTKVVKREREDWYQQALLLTRYSFSMASTACVFSVVNRRTHR